MKVPTSFKFCFLLLFERQYGFKVQLPKQIIAEEMRLNEEYHRKHIVATSDMCWGAYSLKERAASASSGNEKPSVISRLVKESQCSAIIDEFQRLRPPASTFTMTGANLRECHVQDLPETKQWLLDDLLPRLKTDCDLIYDALILQYNQSFSAQHNVTASQPVHRDNCVVTYNIALNEAFSGGGTYFEAENQVIRLQNTGDALFHPAHLRHAGAPTTGGVRWVLVLFLTRRCFIAEDHARTFHIRIHTLLQDKFFAEALTLARCALHFNHKDAEVLILAARAATALGSEQGAHKDSSRFYYTLALRYALKASRLLPRSSAALHAYGQAKLMLSCTPKEAHDAAHAFKNALGFGFLDTAQQGALENSLDLALRTAAYLDTKTNAISPKG